MIKSNELRSGNYIWNTFNNPLIVISINPYFGTDKYIEGVSCKFENGIPSGFSPIDKINPIPLTEEILLKCGFKDGSLGIESDYGAMLYGNTTTVSLEDCDGGDIGIKIKYVHQLQNLIFALTGKELQITL